MAKLNAPFEFTGSIGNVSVYMMRGVDKPVMRQKGGPSKSRMKTHPNFANTRKRNTEFGGRSIGSKWIRWQISPVKQLADYNIAGPLNALLKPIQAMDTNNLGERHVLLSKNPQLLSGFLLNRKNNFDSTIRNPLSFSLDRQTLSAQVDIPALIPGVNFVAPVTYPVYRIIACLGIIPDLFCNDSGYLPSSNEYSQQPAATIFTDWYPVMKGSAAMTLELQSKRTLPDNNFSLVLSIGVSYGVMKDTAEIWPAVHAGAAKILGMA